MRPFREPLDEALQILGEQPLHRELQEEGLLVLVSVLMRCAISVFWLMFVLLLMLLLELQLPIPRRVYDEIRSHEDVLAAIAAYEAGTAHTCPSQ
jgi:hypothetical protein